MVLGSLTLIIALISLVGIIGVVIYLLRNKKGWKCVEGKCEFIQGGDHSTKADCEKDNCRQEKKYICSSEYECVVSPEGVSLEECKSSCKKPEEENTTVQYVYPAYYPQSLYQRPYYWRPGRRHWRPRRGGRGRR